MAFGTRVDVIGHRESRERSSIGECAKGQLIERELAENFAWAEDGVERVVTAAKKEGFEKKGAANCASSWEAKEAETGRCREVGGVPGRAAQGSTSTKPEPDRAVWRWDSRCDSTSVCLLASVTILGGWYVEQAGRQAGRLVDRQEAGRQGGGQGGW